MQKLKLVKSYFIGEIGEIKKCLIKNLNLHFP